MVLLLNNSFYQTGRTEERQRTWVKTEHGKTVPCYVVPPEVVYVGEWNETCGVGDFDINEKRNIY